MSSVECLVDSKYLYQKLKQIDDELGELVLDPQRAPYSLSVTFNRSHIYTMKHVSKQVIDKFVEDLHAELIGI